MKTYHEFRHSSSCELEYEFLVSTCRTVEAVTLSKKDGVDVYTKRVSKIERVLAASLENAAKKFEESDTYILFSARNKGYKLYKFYISADRRLRRFIEASTEIFDVYKKYQGTVLEFLYKYYQQSLNDNWIPSSIFSDYFWQEYSNGFLPPDVSQIEKYIIDNCTETTRDEYNLLVKNSCITPKEQLDISKILFRAAEEERKNNRPIYTDDPWECWFDQANSYYAPSLSWALKAIESHYPPAFYWTGLLMGRSGKDIKPKRPIQLSLMMHAALLGDINAQMRLAIDHATKTKSPEFPALVDHNPDISKFWFERIIEKNDPDSFENIALFYCRILNNDQDMANTYYQRLVDLGKEEYYSHLISGFINLDDFVSANNTFDKLLKINNEQALKKVFHDFEVHDTFAKFDKRNVKFELANRIIQLSNDVLFHAYLAEYYQLRNDSAAFKRCIYVILGSSDVEAISKTYNLFKKSVFLNLNNLELELEFVTIAEKLGNHKASLLLQKGYKKGVFGGWKRSRDWANYDL